MVPLMPYQLSLYCRRLCGTLSKALLKSMMIIESNQFVRGCWTGPGRGKEAECHMRSFFESRVEVHREFCSSQGVA